MLMQQTYLQNLNKLIYADVHNLLYYRTTGNLLYYRTTGRCGVDTLKCQSKPEVRRQNSPGQPR